MKTETIIPAIAKDGSLFPIEKLRAHLDSVFHVAVSVFVFDGDDLLIQRRAGSKYHCAGQWANSCCTHPHWNESIEVCALRRLREELGFAIPLESKRIVEYSADVGGGLHEHERVTMFVGEARRETIVIRPDPAEVSETRWISPPELRDEMRRRPDSFTPWFRIYLNRFPDLRF